MMQGQQHSDYKVHRKINNQVMKCRIFIRIQQASEHALFPKGQKQNYKQEVAAGDDEESLVGTDSRVRGKCRNVSLWMSHRETWKFYCFSVQLSLTKTRINGSWASDQDNTTASLFARIFFRAVQVKI